MTPDRGAAPSVTLPCSTSGSGVAVGVALGATTWVEVALGADVLLGEAMAVVVAVAIGVSVGLATTTVVAVGVVVGPASSSPPQPASTRPAMTGARNHFMPTPRVWLAYHTGLPTHKAIKAAADRGRDRALWAGALQSRG